MEIRPDLPEQDPTTGSRRWSIESDRAAEAAVDARENRTNWARISDSASWWWLVSALAIALIFAIGGLYLLRYLARSLALFVLAIALATALIPIVDRLCCPQGLDGPRRMPRWLAVVIVFLTLILLLVALVAMAVPMLADQTRSLVDNSDTWLPRVTQWAAQFGFDSGQILNTLSSQLGRVSSYIISVPMDVFSGVGELLLVIFIALYWVLLTPRIRRFTLSFFPSGNRGNVEGVLKRMGGAMGGYMRGAAINGVIIAVVAYIGLTIIGVPYSLFLAAFAGVMEFFPIIGAVLAVGLSTLVALSVSPAVALITLIFGIVLQQVEGNVLVPIVMRSQAEISPLLSIFAVLAGGSVGGLLGALVAIPLAAALQVLVVTVIAPALRRANGVEEEAAGK